MVKTVLFFLALVVYWSSREQPSSPVTKAVSGLLFQGLSLSSLTLVDTKTVLLLHLLSRYVVSEPHQL